MAKMQKVKQAGRSITPPAAPKPSFDRASQGAALTKQAHRGPGPNPVRKPAKNPS